MDFEQAIERLKEGNGRFLSSNLDKKDFAKKRKELVGGQKPFCTILSCSDSRIVPEYIFDADMGEMFVIRNAGVLAVDDIALGSLEYGCCHLRTPLLVVLAHQNCGAVCATCDCRGKSEEGHIKDIINAIAPAAKEKEFEKQETIIESAKKTVEKIPKNSEGIKKLVDGQKLKIVPAYYSMESGKVEFL